MEWTIDKNRGPCSFYKGMSTVHDDHWPFFKLLFQGVVIQPASISLLIIVATWTVPHWTGNLIERIYQLGRVYDLKHDSRRKYLYMNLHIAFAFLWLEGVNRRVSVLGFPNRVMIHCISTHLRASHDRAWTFKFPLCSKSIRLLQLGLFVHWEF